MIIDDLDVQSVIITPLETDPPLLVDSDAVLALSIAALRALRRAPFGSRRSKRITTI